MRIRVKDNQVHVWFRCEGNWWNMKEDLKNLVPGIRFKKDEVNVNRSYWWIPLNPISAEAILNFASFYSFIFVDNAQEQIMQVVRAANQNIEASAATNANVELAVKKGLKLLPFQKAGVVFAREKDKVLISDEMGLGKTVQALTLCNEWNAKNILVICPASIKINWQREAEKWLINDHTFGIQMGGTKPLPDASVVIINYDLLQKKQDDLMARSWDVVIVDECHNVKNTKLMRTRIVFGYEYKSKNARSQWQETVKPIPRKKTVLLTGTPLPNRPKEMWPFANYCEPHVFNNWYKYMKRYCAAYEEWIWTKIKDKNTGRMRAVQLRIFHTDGHSNEEELNKLLRSTFMVRRMKKDVMKELGPKTRQVIELSDAGVKSVVNESRKFLKNNKALIDQIFDPDQKNPSAETPEFQELSKLRRELGIAKIPAAKEFIKEQLEINGKLVVFAHHTEILESLYSEFKDIAVMIHGQVNQNNRQAAVDQFQQNDSCRLMLSGILSGGVGITLTASSHVIFLEEPFRPGDVSQAEDRCHRIGQTDNVLVQHLVFTDSLDQYMINMLIEKSLTIAQVLDEVNTYQAPEPKPLATPGPVEKKERKYNMSDEQIEATHVAIKYLAGRCDGAVKEDEMGFNGSDARFGHSLAKQARLTEKQAFFGRKMVDKYHGQYGNGLREKMWGKKFEVKKSAKQREIEELWS